MLIQIPVQKSGVINGIFSAWDEVADVTMSSPREFIANPVAGDKIVMACPDGSWPDEVYTVVRVIEAGISQPGGAMLPRRVLCDNGFTVRPATVFRATAADIANAERVAAKNRAANAAMLGRGKALMTWVDRAQTQSEASE
jgi:hypothetical protein